MRMLVVGCNHRSAPVALRERMAFDQAQIPALLATLRARWPGAEAVLLSTCNRIELYLAHTETGELRIAEAIGLLAEARGVELADVTEAFYSYEGLEATRHLFRMVSSLDSMVMGESQILAQTRSAFELARDAGTIGKTFDELFQYAFRVAKEIHTRTAIATGRVSVGSTAVDLARQIFARLDDKIVLMVGAGKMGELTLTHLLSHRPKAIRVTNRTEPRAVDLARRLERQHQAAATVVPFEAWVDALAEVDIVITSTGAREPILTAKAFEPIPARRRYRSLLLIDIAVPRNLDPAIGDAENVFLYNIDDLQSITEAGLQQRREAIDACHEIIEAHLARRAERSSSEDLGPLINALRVHLKNITDQELRRLVPKLQDASEHDRGLIEQTLHRVTQKILNDPLQALRNAPATGPARVYADALRALFKLDVHESDP